MFARESYAQTVRMVVLCVLRPTTVVSACLRTRQQMDRRAVGLNRHAQLRTEDPLIILIRLSLRSNHGDGTPHCCVMTAEAPLWASR